MPNYKPRDLVSFKIFWSNPLTDQPPLFVLPHPRWGGVGGCWKKGRLSEKPKE